MVTLSQYIYKVGHCQLSRCKWNKQIRKIFINQFNSFGFFSWLRRIWFSINPKLTSGKYWICIVLVGRRSSGIDWVGTSSPGRFHISNWVRDWPVGQVSHVQVIGSCITLQVSTDSQLEINYRQTVSIFQIHDMRTADTFPLPVGGAWETGFQVLLLLIRNLVFSVT